MKTKRWRPPFGGTPGVPLFVGAIHLRWDVESVPVHDVFLFGVVPHVHDDWLSLPRAQDRTGNLAVVGKRSDGTAGRQIERHLADPQCDVGFANRWRRWPRSRTRSHLMLAARGCVGRSPTEQASARS